MLVQQNFIDRRVPNNDRLSAWYKFRIEYALLNVRYELNMLYFELNMRYFW